MALIVKTQADLQNDTVARLVALGYTDAQFAGTGVRNILDSIDAKLFAFYSNYSESLKDQYLSQARGPALDALGMLVGCFRRGGEDDQAYRVRITKAYTTNARATLDALVSALQSLSNVREVIVRPFTQGAGSLTFYLIPITAPLDTATLSAAQASVTAIAAGGAFTVVTTPTTRLVNLTGALSGAGELTAAARANATAAVARYIATLSMGEPLVLAEITRAVLDADASIIDFVPLTLSTTDSAGITTEQLLRNYTPLFDEELQPGSIALV